MEITIRPPKNRSANWHIYLSDLYLGGAKDHNEAVEAALEKLENYTTTCLEALEMLDAEREMGLPFAPEPLIAMSPLSVWLMNDGAELQVKGTQRSGYTLSRIRGNYNASTARQLFEGALSRLESAQAECETSLSS